jgi:hypothetical protein
MLVAIEDMVVTVKEMGDWGLIVAYLHASSLAIYPMVRLTLTDYGSCRQ